MLLQIPISILILFKAATCLFHKAIITGFEYSSFRFVPATLIAELPEHVMPNYTNYYTLKIQNNHSLITQLGEHLGTNRNVPGKHCQACSLPDCT